MKVEKKLFNVYKVALKIKKFKSRLKTKKSKKSKNFRNNTHSIQELININQMNIVMIILTKNYMKTLNKNKKKNPMYQRKTKIVVLHLRLMKFQK